MPGYKRPPIVESVIEVKFLESVAEKNLQKIVDKLKDKYPFVSPQAEMKVTLEFQEKGFVKQQNDFIKGFRLENVDSQSVAVITPQSLVMSALAPYRDWSQLFDPFVHAWKIMKSIAGFRTVTRIGCRFVNRIDIPITDNTAELNIADFLTLGIQSPTGINVQAYEATMLLKIDKAFSANVKTATILPVIPFTAALLLDTDVFTDKEIPQTESDLFEIISSMREKKNTLFEKFITPKAREVFNRELE